ncbi:hypothetical protein PybrP1_007214 [[Pythium] brassicae (nom. inval.)]|nr:hypothetical protein PybrP1_007214 [[Pythium] brassicae (nom. inval.)]
MEPLPGSGDGEAAQQAARAATEGVEVVDLASDEPLEEPAADSQGGSVEQPLQVPSSDDAFEPPPPPLAAARKRVRPAAEADDASAKPAVVLKAQPTECSICYDPCMISGRHRLVSLRCGHLFGKKCIERWVTERKTCPNCNVAVRKADVRPLFSDHVAVVDNSGVEAMRQKYEHEKSKRIQAETELSRAKLQMEVLVADSKRHQDEALHWRKEFADLRCSVASERFTSAAAASMGSLPHPTAPEPRSKFAAGGGEFLLSQQPVVPDDSDAPAWNYTEVFSRPLKNSRVFAIAASCTMLCVGDELSATQFGVLKVSTADPRHAAHIAAHQSPVRDLRISTREDLALTVAFDGKLVVSNLHSQSVVLQCALPPGKRQGWSCAFSSADPFTLYCGFHDGSVAKYDMRKPGGNDAVVAAFAAHERQPVHSLRLFSAPDGSERLVAATFSGVSVWNDCSSSGDSSNGRVADAHVSVPSCCSLASVQTRPASVLASSRTLPQTPAKHALFDLAHMDSAGSALAAQSVVTGHRTPPMLARSAAWEAPDGAIVVASGDDESKQVLLWDAASNQVRHRLRPFSANQVVIDVQHSVAHGSWRSKRALFGVLSAQKIALFSSAG